MRETFTIDEALAYARKHELHALVVARGATVLAEVYGDGFDAAEPHPLYSGTKSFWGIAALSAQRDGLIDLDASVAPSIPAWKGDAAKAKITPRMLLGLTAGYGFGGLGSAVPAYDRAIEIPLKTAPGTTFTYGGIPLQVFGAYFSARLTTLGLTPHEYLAQNILKPAGVTIASWRALKDGTHPLPTGVQLSAYAWLEYGRYVLAHRKENAEAFVGSSANARYGLGWWLGSPGAPDDLIYASGSGGQALYLVPSLDLTIVHFGKSASYKHDAFLKRCFTRSAVKPRRSGRGYKALGA